MTLSERLIAKYSVPFVVAPAGQTFQDFVRSLTSDSGNVYVVIERAGEFRLAPVAKLTEYLSWTGKDGLMAPLAAFPLNPPNEVIKRSTSSTSQSIENDLNSVADGVFLIVDDERMADPLQAVVAVLVNTSASATFSDILSGIGWSALIGGLRDGNIPYQRPPKKTTCPNCGEVNFPVVDAKQMKWLCPNCHKERMRP